MTLQILSFYPIDHETLAPVPNVTESEYFSKILEKDETPVITDLQGVHLKVLTGHRGTVLYCAGDVTVYRVNPTTYGGNGMYAVPSPGTEETVEISTAHGRFRGRLCSVQMTCKCSDCTSRVTRSWDRACTTTKRGYKTRNLSWGQSVVSTNHERPAC